MAVMNSERFRVNLFSFVVSLAVIFVAVKFSDGSFATRINKIGVDLNKDLSVVMDRWEHNFTELNQTGNYYSNTTFDPKGMAGLYNITVAFMEAVFSKDLYPEGFIQFENNNIKLGDYQKEWKSLLATYGGLLAMVIVLLLFLVFMPLCGFCFCCCRCCGKCGARSQPFDKKHDLCKKIVLATLLICLGTMLLFGVVCAFVSNEQLNDGVHDVTKDLRTGIKDVQEYLRVTDKQAATLLNRNYQEFAIVLKETFNKSTEIVYNQLAQFSNATAMTSLVFMKNRIPEIRDNFVTLKYSANVLRVYASMLNDAVRGVKRDLNGPLNDKECNFVPKCRDLRDQIHRLNTEIHFDKLPDITTQLEHLDKLVNNSQFKKYIDQGEKVLQDMKDEIGDAVQSALDEADKQIDRAGLEIRKGSDNISSVIKDLTKQIDDHTWENLGTADDYIVKYMPYRYYGGLALSCVLLLISICITLGLICGICGKRPDAYGNDCCNKGAGSQFLMCGVSIIFISSLVIAIVILVSFLSGILVQRIGCDTLRDPENSKLFKLVDQIKISNYDINISQILTNCHKNKSIYQVLNLENYFNLSEVKEYVKEFRIDEALKKIDLKSIDFDKINILDPTAAVELRKIANDFDFSDVSWDEFKNLMNTSFTTVGLDALTEQLNFIIGEPKIPDRLKSQLNLTKLHIETYQTKIVVPLTNNATAVVKLAETLEELLKFNHTSFPDAVNITIKEIEDAQNYLKINGSAVLEGTVENFTQTVLDQVQSYLNRVVYKTDHEVGRCGPLSVVINAALTSTCDKIILPWNGYWFGLFWSLLLFIPIIIIAVKLSTLYQKYNPYSGPLVETEYLYDAYADRDNIPLNSRGGKKKKNKKQKHYEERSTGDMVARDYAAPSHQDQRYQDMAPKHWEEFPAGGPPQYQRAPTEYERPPPYYYPAAAESNNQ